MRHPGRRFHARHRGRHRRRRQVGAEPGLVPPVAGGQAARPVEDDERGVERGIVGEEPVEEAARRLRGSPVGEEGGLVLHRHGGERRRCEQGRGRRDQPCGDDQDRTAQQPAASAAAVGIRHVATPASP